MIKVIFYPGWVMPETEHLARCSFIFFIFFVSFFANVLPQTYPDKNVDSLLKSGITNIINQDYTRAEFYFNKLNDDYPEIPLGKIYLAALKIAEAYDYSEEFEEDKILELLNDAKEQSEQLLEDKPDNKWNMYCYALAEGYSAYYDAINDNWFSAISTGIKSISSFEDILALDSTFYEAYIAIGTFEYWKSRKTEWLPFVNDTKKIGIKQLKIAIDSTTYNSYLAVYSLIWIYIDQKQYEAAAEIAEDALNEFPLSRSFKWGLARACEELNPQRAINLYYEILNSYPEKSKKNFINEITLKHLIAQQYVKTGNKQKALEICIEILNLKNLPERTRDVLEDRLERVKELKNELSEQR